MIISTVLGFGTTLVLSLTGTLAIKRSHNFIELFFAATPFIFVVHQICEGLMRFAVLHPGYACTQQTATFVFLLFAYIVWPVWMIFSIMLLENNDIRKIILCVILAVGITQSFFTFHYLVSHNVGALGLNTNNKALFNNAPIIRNYGLVYFISMVLPPFISSVKKMWYLGCAIIILDLIRKSFSITSVLQRYFFEIITGIAVVVIMNNLRTSLWNKNARGGVIPDHIF